MSDCLHPLLHAGATKSERNSDVCELQEEGEAITKALRTPGVERQMLKFKIELQWNRQATPLGVVGWFNIDSSSKCTAPGSAV